MDDGDLKFQKQNLQRNNIILVGAWFSILEDPGDGPYEMVVFGSKF